MYYQRQVIIYICEFLASLSFTILAAFYPGLASEKGIPIWLVGLIFSLDPILGLPTAFLVGKSMNRFGRKNFVSIGILFSAIGIFLIGLLEHVDKSEAIVLSITSRVFAGIGAGCSLTATGAILIIEYPDEIDMVMGYYEASSGLGLLLGPIVGSFLSLFDLSVSFCATALVYAAYALVAHKGLGQLTPSETQESATSYSQILLKPVRTI
jgi:MFS family permease